MEGLLPMVYKSLKKTKTRRRYECLSSGSASTYKIEDFYAKDEHQDHYIDRHFEHKRGDNVVVPDLHGPHHRRSSSVHVDPKPKHLVRFSSQRLFFSCVTGG